MPEPSPRSLPPLSRVLLTLCLLVATLSLLWFLLTQGQIRELTLAAGDPEGESYILSQAIAQVITANHPRLHIKVIATSGSDENLQLLEKNQAQLATTQADTPAGPAARSLAVLYRDLFQLVVRPDSGIQTLSDLTGHTVLLQPSSGEFYSFLNLITHYGLNLESFHLNFVNDQQADDLFRQNQADALFRVRTPNNLYMTRLVQEAQGRFLAIDQADALKIRYPALEPGFIPQGTYQGRPPIPPSNLRTIAVERLFLASRTLDNATVREITQILIEHRRDIANAIPDEHEEVRPLVSNFKRPSVAGGTGIPQHRGAIAYYERDRPTLLTAIGAFFLQNGSVFIAISTLPAGSLIGLWEWWQRVRQRADERKLLADQYIRDAIQNMKDEPELEPQSRQKWLQERQDALERVFNEAANAVVREDISQESFRTFNEAYKTTREVLERRREAASQELSDSYIQLLITLLQHPPNPVAEIQQSLNSILEKVETSLINKEISQESFRTFIEAYKMARDILQVNLK
ncbi:MAG: TAXI family TRAP transporter solute-binding subunit [Leptolyngbyaceae cyanobacterium bins.59]|nr:TAXI family TRAP transporter solute-binding subunit [Leptolyngbyaceae cyanobacterium bins.59]